MKLDFTEQEAQATLECVDTALKQHGIRALGVANMLVNKFNAARIAEQNEKTTSLAAVPDSVGPAAQG